MKAALPFILFGLVASPVAAQREIDPDRIDRSQVGTRFQVQLEAMEGDEMRVFMKRIGRCLARSDRELSARILENSDPVDIDYDAVGMEFGEIGEELNMGRCIGQSMPPSARYMRINYTGALIRGMLAEEMYLYANDEAPAIPEGAPVDLENRFFVGGMGSLEAVYRARIADCVVFNASELSHQFLDSNPNSKDEREAAQALAPVFDTCIDSEEQLTFTLAQMRPFLADGLWSRSQYGQDSYAAVGEAE